MIRKPKLEAVFAAFPGKQGKFLESLYTKGFVSQACTDAGMERIDAFKLRHTDNAFMCAWDSALEARRVVFADGLEKSALDKAINGWIDDVYYKGNVVGQKRVYSPVLMIFMLKALRPDVYMQAEDTNNASPQELAQKVVSALKTIEADSGIPTKTKRGKRGN